MASFTTNIFSCIRCRAFYGEVTGTVKVNGHKTSIEEHSSAVGFVPQVIVKKAAMVWGGHIIFFVANLPLCFPLEQG